MPVHSRHSIPGSNRASAAGALPMARSEYSCFTKSTLDMVSDFDLKSQGTQAYPEGPLFKIDKTGSSFVLNLL
jgi:hypothetical protein